MIQSKIVTILSVVASVALVDSFSVLPTRRAHGSNAVSSVTSWFMTAENTTAETVASTTSVETTDNLIMPATFDEMIRQASSAMSDAYDLGINRQMIRVLLPRDPSNDKLGVYYEEDADLDTQNLVLMPTDESWQGGIMQLYRAAAPTCRELLRYDTMTQHATNYRRTRRLSHQSFSPILLCFGLDVSLATRMAFHRA